MCLCALDTKIITSSLFHQTGLESIFIIFKGISSTDQVEKDFSGVKTDMSTSTANAFSLPQLFDLNDSIVVL